MDHECEHTAPGGPGLTPTWSSAVKDGVGTSATTSSNLWFTLESGLISEVYWPTIDRAQLRDLQFLISDGESWMMGEREMTTKVESLEQGVLGYRVSHRDRAGRFEIVKNVVSDPEQPMLLIETTLHAHEELDFYLLVNPHLDLGGRDNDAFVADVAGQPMLIANKGDSWMAISTSVPMAATSVGFVGYSDGWTDISGDFQMHFDFDCAHQGNVALTARLDLSATNRFVTALAFGDCDHAATTSALQGTALSFEGRKDVFVKEWDTINHDLIDLADVSCDDGLLFYSSRSLLRSHEDKRYQGALIASLSIPWGEAKGDEELGGYHLVWSRDMVNTATGLLSVGDYDTPTRALLYLATSQLPDGGFYQNFWINGEPYWRGIQLDEVAFPVILAYRLHELGALGSFDPMDLILRAVAYMIRQGPATPQERWEEAAGYSPSTLASNIAALVCGAHLVRERGDEATATFIEQYADFLEQHIESWTVTNRGTLHPDIARHYIRINPDDPSNPIPAEDPDDDQLTIANRGPDEEHTFPANQVVDAGFLELVRYGIRPPGDPLIEDSLAVVDHVLKVETRAGPIWRRYNHDGYGEGPGGEPYHSHGVGRAWPLLTGERGHYELAAGRPVDLYLRALEGFAFGAGVLPEQVWDADDIPERGLKHGQATGGASPLMWAHAEYVKLLRSKRDGQVFDRLPIVSARYLADRQRRPIQVWKLNRQVQTVPVGCSLRIQVPNPFVLLWDEGSESTSHIDATDTALGISYADAPESDRSGDIGFRLQWPDGTRSEVFIVSIVGR